MDGLHSTLPPPALQPILTASRARQVGRDKWRGHCLNPSHDDKNPSMSVRLMPDGTILVNCFGGCAKSDILGGINLTLRDLFPSRKPLSASELRAIEAQQRKAERLAALRRDAERHAARKLYKLTACVDELGTALATTPDSDPRGAWLTEIFHTALRKMREAEARLAELQATK
jgi:hypothetical protein